MTGHSGELTNSANGFDGNRELRILLEASLKECIGELFIA